MRMNFRIIALLMCLAIFVSSLVSCGKIIIDTPAGSADITSEAEESSSSPSAVSTEEPTDTLPIETTDEPSETDKPSEDEEKNYTFEIVYPTVSVSTLKLEPMDKKFDEFKSKLSLLESIFKKNEKGSENEFKGELYEILSLLAELETQSDIAYLMYICDMSGSDTWNNYIRLFNLHDDASDLLWEFYNSSRKESNCLVPTLNAVFDKEFKSRVPVGDSSDYYSDKMNTLEGEYNSLVNSGASTGKIFEVYKKYLAAADGFAKEGRTENYYEYASKYTYGRTDTAEQRERLRQYTKEYLVPMLKELKIKSRSYDEQLSYSEYNLSNKYLEDSYDSFGENYLFEYFDSLPQSTGDHMKSAFEKDRVIIGDKKSSYKSAMVTEIGNTSICYFHEDETNLETVAHELGHYYADSVSDDAYYSYSLSETHSCTNTMLFFSYLSDKLDSRAFRSAELYIMYNWMYQAVTSVIKDEFDEIIFSSDPSALTVEYFESVMSDLIDEYDVSGLTGSIDNQLITYWSRVGITYPMRNYCYAVAQITAFQLYVMSKDDYAAACEIYKKIVEEPENRGSFNATIVKAGLTTPYAEKTYIEIQKLVDV